ncbi:hypothetical protein ABZ864_47605 [Streptomyces sp. NPDC047082]|uniref:hypothetical protein n=1 Tax=Streptomyces sp. NPDC047082 TaxID=3155259 RepID=UPI0033FC6718
MSDHAVPCLLDNLATLLELAPEQRPPWLQGLIANFCDGTPVTAEAIHSQLTTLQQARTAQHPPTTPTTRIRTGGGYAVTAYTNTTPGSVLSGYDHSHSLTEVTTTDGSPLHLTFTSVLVTSVHKAADAAFVVGTGHGSDDAGQCWPDTARRLNVGDVLAITAPDGTTAYLSIDRSGFSTIEPPTT